MSVYAATLAYDQLQERYTEALFIYNSAKKLLVNVPGATEFMNQLQKLCLGLKEKLTEQERNSCISCSSNLRLVLQAIIEEQTINVEVLASQINYPVDELKMAIYDVEYKNGTLYTVLCDHFGLNRQRFSRYLSTEE